MVRIGRRGLTLACVGLGLTPATGLAGPVAPQTFSQLGLAPASAQGTVASAEQFVPVPPGEALTGGRLVVRFRHSSLLRADVSTMTVLVNGRAMASTRLTGGNAGGGSLTVPLPALPGAAGAVISERFYMRISRGCEDPANPALWSVVEPTSQVALQLVPARRTVADAVADLAPAATGAPLTVVLPARPDRADLEAAGLMVAAVGRHDGTRNADPLVRASLTVPATGAYLAILPGPAGVSVTRTGAVGVTLRGSGTELLRVASAVADGAVAGVDDASLHLAQAPVGAPAAALAWAHGAASFAQLGMSDQTVGGSGVTPVDLDVPRPPQWTPTGTATLHLGIAPGGGLAGPGDTGAAPSTVSVSLAGHALGSRRLVPGGVDELNFSVPAGLLSTDLAGHTLRSLPLALTFDLQAPHPACAPIDPDGATATLLDTSSLSLPHTVSDQLDLSRFPAPLSEPGRQVAVVLPRDPGPAVLTAGLQIAAAVGRWSDPSSPLPLLLGVGSGAGRPPQGRPTILLGNADAQLGHPLDGPDPLGGTPGHAQLLLGPSGPNGLPALAVHAVDGPGLDAAALALTEAADVQRLRGTAMAVTATAATLTAHDAAPAPAPPVELAPQLARSLWATIPPWAIPAAVLLAVLLIGGGLVARARWGSPRRRSAVR